MIFWVTVKKEANNEKLEVEIQELRERGFEIFYLLDERHFREFRKRVSTKQGCTNTFISQYSLCVVLSYIYRMYKKP